MHNYRYTGETDEVFRRLDAASALEARIPESLDPYMHDRALTLLQAQEVIQNCLATGMDTIDIPDHIIDTMFSSIADANPIASNYAPTMSNEGLSTRIAGMEQQFQGTDADSTITLNSGLESAWTTEQLTEMIQGNQL